MNGQLIKNSDRLSRRISRVLEVLIIVSVAPAVAYGVWSLNNVPVV